MKINSVIIAVWTIVSFSPMRSHGQAQTWDNELHGSDYMGDGRGTPLEIPLVVELWSDAYFNGDRRVIVRNEPNLGDGVHCQAGARFNDVTSSIKVHPGPDYASWKARHSGAEPTVTLYSDAKYGGEKLRVQTGLYNDLKRIHFNDAASSVRFDDPGDNSPAVTAPQAGAADPVSSIPLVLRLHTAAIDKNTNGKCDEDDDAMWLVSPTNNIKEYGEFNDNVSWVEVFKGPNWKNDQVSFFENIPSENQGGRYVSYHAPMNADLVADNFNDILSSILFNYIPPPPPVKIVFSATPSDGGGPNARINIGQIATLHWNVTDCPGCVISVRGEDYDTHSTVYYVSYDIQNPGTFIVKPPISTQTLVNYTLTACGNNKVCGHATCYVSVYHPASTPPPCQPFYFKFSSAASFSLPCFTVEFCDKNEQAAMSQAKAYQQAYGYGSYTITNIDGSQVNNACQ